MGLLADFQIHELALDGERPMIVPFYAEKKSTQWFTPQDPKPSERSTSWSREPVESKILSYGLSSYGYDIRLASELYVFTNRHASTLDPLDFDHRNYDKAEVRHDEVGRPYVLIPPNGFLLGHSVEYIKLPSDVQVIVLSKSTYARIGNVCLATPLEAGWEGQVTLEFANTAPSPSKMYIDQGCAQLLFFQGDEPARRDYLAMGGKYQGQLGVTFSKG